MNETMKCPSCGAPAVSEICAYCGSATGIHSSETTMEYPLLECKEAVMNFWTVCFPLIFAVSFGITGMVSLSIGSTGFGGGVWTLVGLPFFLIGLAAAWFVLRTVYRYLRVKKGGTMLRATVYGYMDDQVLINDRPAQVVKLLVHTPDGPRFILYQLGETMKPYVINENIDIMMDGEYFLIVKKNLYR